MAATLQVTELLNGTLSAMKNVIGQEVINQRVSRVDGSMAQRQIGVLVGVMGELTGRLFVDGTIDTFSALATQMYGVTLEGELLESFISELGNMLAGHTVVAVSEAGMTMNITTPTLVSGETRLIGFSDGIQLALEFAEIGEMRTTLIFEE